MAGRPEVRIPKVLKVKVRGRDQFGHTFVQTAYTVNVSRKGARLDGLRCLQGPGQVIEVGRWWKKAEFRVVWVGQPGTGEMDQAGLCSVESDQTIWGLEFPEPGPQADAPPRVAAPPAPVEAAPPPAWPADPPAGTNHYRARVRCPQGDEDLWITLRDRPETLAQVQQTRWDFDCPVHGTHEEIPLEVRAISSPPASPRPPEQPEKARVGPETRRGARRPRQIALLVQGWTTEGKSFIEEASTLVVNGNGGLVTLSAPVGLGQKLSLVNRANQKTQQCRVAYIGAQADGKAKVGIALG
ncbi:MAG: hypothetical protein ACRD2R_04465, partial [Terriglobales bacterium]